MNWNILDCTEAPPQSWEVSSGDTSELGGDGKWKFEGREDHAFLRGFGNLSSISVNGDWYDEKDQLKLLPGADYTVVLPNNANSLPLLISGGEESPDWGNGKMDFFLVKNQTTDEGPFKTIEEVRQALRNMRVDREMRLWVAGSTLAFELGHIWPQLVTRRRIKKGSMICPFCRLSFRKGNLLYFSTDKPSERPGRPSVFKDGVPLDENGTTMGDRACPHCGSRLPSSFGKPYYYFPLVGQANSGKSYFLATMLTELPVVLDRYDLGFGNDGPGLNEAMDTMKEKPYKPGPPEERYIDKTDHSQNTQIKIQVRHENKPRPVPKPFIYEITPGDSIGDGSIRAVFYDNPGEHFTAVVIGETATDLAEFATSHLLLAETIFLLYDPTISMEIAVEIHKEKMRERGQEKRMNADQMEQFDESQRTARNLQDTMISKLKEQMERHKSENIPVIVLVGKSDAWRDLPDAPDCETSPYKKDGRLDKKFVLERSEHLRKFLREKKTGVPASMRAISNDVTYFPVSALGQVPVKITDNDGKTFYAPADRAQPQGVEVPFLWALEMLKPEWVPTVAL